MIVKENNEIYSTDGKFVHIKDTDSYFKRAVAIGLTEDMCEEVDTIPKIINNEEYGKQVNDLIRLKYSLSEELSILRQKDTKQGEWEEYNVYCEECKTTVKNKLNEKETSD